MKPLPLPTSALRAILWTQWTYWCALAIAVWAAIQLPPGSTRTILILTPILPAFLIFGVTYWIYRSCDEYIRLRILQAGAITATVIAFATMSYYFLERLGFPKVSMGWVSNLAWGTFIVQMLLLKFRS
jgi:hypothetical protein